MNGAWAAWIGRRLRRSPRLAGSSKLPTITACEIKAFLLRPEGLIALGPPDTIAIAEGKISCEWTWINRSGRVQHLAGWSIYSGLLEARRQEHEVDIDPGAELMVMYDLIPTASPTKPT